MKDHLKTKFTKKQLTDAGLALILLFLLIFMVHGNKRLIFGSAFVAVLCMIHSSLIYPWAVLWYTLTEILGTIVSKILLTVIFIFIVWPVGLTRHLIGKDSLQLKNFRRTDASVFHIREKQFLPEDLDTPY